MTRPSFVKISLVSLAAVGLALGLLMCCSRDGATPRHSPGPEQPVNSNTSSKPDQEDASRHTPAASALATSASATTTGHDGSPRAHKLRNISYGPDPAHLMDVYLPAASGPAPILLMIHGGAWKLGDKEARHVVDNKLQHWGSKGYVFISANYRLSQVTPLDEAEDVARTIAHVQKQANSWNADPKKLVVMGHSSGAHLVALVSSDETLRAELEPWLGTIALDSAAYDVGVIMRRRHFRFYDQAFGPQEDFWTKASPILQLRSAPAPFLAVCSSLRSDSCPQAQAYVDKVNALGGRAQLLPVAKSHQEINADLGQPGSYTQAVDDFMVSLGLR